ncbi:hypothetical protein M409DRAFT_49025 [Zasmidium cellare ATCC 36951]|uniref:Uncharacterized protein n=1 Tax=Zasmidium cellare ATCC 36951 TaxID=1080233 RepID=A0A6A6D6U4_ZASCE|nr:uncharacterized protein M409DRAFT_49025 [Zasmidium cellare ATCC 36951]KAF2174158.1 hypothetical protein M409DRAFT_49025 [Zasmidium cellare ATCC 36951]
MASRQWIALHSRVWVWDAAGQMSGRQQCSMHQGRESNTPREDASWRRLVWRRHKRLSIATPAGACLSLDARATYMFEFIHSLLSRDGWPSRQADARRMQTIRPSDQAPSGPGLRFITGGLNDRLDGSKRAAKVIISSDQQLDLVRLINRPLQASHTTTPSPRTC